ncbi:patatin-like phospholipase family protein [Herminiimonas sp. CN]|uniref:patatin-like phospholipase family protein n=1 Tax=Herminiimonas sp. CN TaxID=1349818 RepID=UPI0004737404|nr:patatin-like phospholipase family protein [Herminiimonas sp. CN]
MKTDTPAHNSLNPKNDRIVLVLQGGGALGAYQAGVFHALHEHDLMPDWVVGTSIGAINAAIIAGNDKTTCLERLKEFWNRVSRKDSVDMQKIPDQARRFNINLSTLDTVTRGVPGFFSPRMFNPFAIGLAVAPEQASFYDTSELNDTLTDLVDFKYLNAGGATRLTVNAMQVKSGQLASFDSAKQAIGVEHIMASGALPPGFPPVRVDGELYWDGGLYSNTPLDSVLDDKAYVDTLCFMVDLWSPGGPEPRTFDEVQTRQKDVMFASRNKRHLESYVQSHKLQQTMRDLYKQLPTKLKNGMAPDTLAAMGADNTLHIVQLSYAGRDWGMALKDINFSRGSIEWRWDQGYQDTKRAIEQAGWLSFISEDTALVVHEIAPYVFEKTLEK